MAGPKPGNSQFNGPENEMTSAGVALAASFFALLIIAIIVHPKIIGGEDSADAPDATAQPAGPR